LIKTKNNIVIYVIVINKNKGRGEGYSVGPDCSASPAEGKKRE
jgi:hypothetical protein